MMQLLTHTSQDTFKTCRRRYWFSYVCGIRRETDAKALRMGSAYARGLQLLGLGRDLSESVEAVRQIYGQCPANFDAYDWEIEGETVVRLICGYDWRWQDSGMEHVEVEFPFELPLLNPETNKPSTIFRLAGKIDGIERLLDSRLAVRECKLLSDDIGHDAPLWRRLRIDHQISLYMVAARRMGYAVETVLYDVTRKPTIKPTDVPILDELGAKIVLDRSGGRVKTERGIWRQSGDKERGYILQTRPMKPDEWGEKLNNDIAERPDFYYRRQEIPRLDQDLAEYKSEIWDIQKTIRDAQLRDRWYRTVNFNTCGYCAFFDLCTTGFNPSSDPLPEGFVRVEDLHPELERTHDGHDSQETAAPAGQS